MDARTPHYLRFARTLALATTIALPACGAADDGAATDEEDHPTSAATPPPDARPAPTAVTSLPIAATPAATPPDSDAGSGDHPFMSGPLPPPEMPSSLA